MLTNLVIATASLVTTQAIDLSGVFDSLESVTINEGSNMEDIEMIMSAFDLDPSQKLLDEMMTEHDIDSDGVTDETFTYEIEPKCCHMYKDVNFGGDSVRYCHNGDRVEIPLAGTGFDEKISSWKCGAEVQYEFWRHDIDW